MYLPCWGGGGGGGVLPLQKKIRKKTPNIKLDTFDSLFFFSYRKLVQFRIYNLLHFLQICRTKPGQSLRPQKKETIIMNSWLVQPYTTYFLSHLNKVHSFFIIHWCACVTIWFYAVPPVGHLRLVHVWYLDFFIFLFQYHNIRTKPLSKNLI